MTIAVLKNEGKIAEEVEGKKKGDLVYPSDKGPTFDDTGMEPVFVFLATSKDGIVCSDYVPEKIEKKEEEKDEQGS